MSIKMAASMSCKNLLKKIRWQSHFPSFLYNPVPVVLIEPPSTQMLASRTFFWNKPEPNVDVAEHKETEVEETAQPVHGSPTPPPKTYTPQPSTESDILAAVRDVIPNADTRTAITDLNHKFQILVSLEERLKLPVNSPDLSNINSVQDIILHYSQAVDSKPVADILASSDLPPNLCLVMDAPKWKPGQPTAFPDRETHIHSLRRRDENLLVMLTQWGSMKGEQNYRKKLWFTYGRDSEPYRG